MAAALIYFQLEQLHVETVGAASIPTLACAGN
jgi:hypothetical protein